MSVKNEKIMVFVGSKEAKLFVDYLAAVSYTHLDVYKRQIHVLFGVLMCIVPVWGVDVLVMFTGLYLILSGVMVLLSAVKYNDL